MRQFNLGTLYRKNISKYVIIIKVERPGHCISSHIWLSFYVSNFVRFMYGANTIRVQQLAILENIVCFVYFLQPVDESVLDSKKAAPRVSITFLSLHAALYLAVCVQ